MRGSFDCESSFYEARRADGRQYLLAGADRLRVGAPSQILVLHPENGEMTGKPLSETRAWISWDCVSS